LIRPTRHERIIQRTEPKSQFLAVRWKMRPCASMCDSNFSERPLSLIFLLTYLLSNVISPTDLFRGKILGHLLA